MEEEVSDVVLLRDSDGSFGFSVLGGAGTKFPAVLCDVEPGGPAALNGNVSYTYTYVCTQGLPTHVQ